MLIANYGFPAFENLFARISLCGGANVCYPQYIVGVWFRKIRRSFALQQTSPSQKHISVEPAFSTIANPNAPVFARKTFNRKSRRKSHAIYFTFCHLPVIDGHMPIHHTISYAFQHRLDHIFITLDGVCFGTKSAYSRRMVVEPRKVGCGLPETASPHFRHTGARFYP